MGETNLGETNLGETNLGETNLGETKGTDKHHREAASDWARWPWRPRRTSRSYTLHAGIVLALCATLLSASVVFVVSRARSSPGSTQRHAPPVTAIVTGVDRLVGATRLTP